MLDSIQEWVFKSCNPENLLNEKIKKLADKFNLSFLATEILCNRGIDTELAISEFLNINFKPVDPFEFYDMEKLVKRLKEAIKNEEKICIYGDYDADGITSTALMYKYLKGKNANVICYIPERNRDGYGLNKNAIDFIKSQNTDVIFTVDNGIVAFDEVEYAKSLGISVLITDHHKVQDTVPICDAAVDPYRNECLGIKYKNFAGVGVAFKVVEALESGSRSFESLLNEFSDLVALGTIGDSIELFGESKKIVEKGIENICCSKRPGIKALIDCLNFNEKQLCVSDIAFGIVPRINACGRIERAKLAFELLVCEDLGESYCFCEELEKLNILRKDTENKIFEEVEKLLNKEPERKKEKIIIAEGKNWEHGVLGIVASKVTQKYNKPCILITIEGETSRGSCRSLENFSIYKVLSSCSQYLSRFGGHTSAAGFSLETNKIKDFKNEILEFSKDIEMPFSKINIDAVLEPADVSLELLNGIKDLEPFGKGNPEPIFGFFDMTLEKVYQLSQGKHLKLKFSKNGHYFEVLCFNKTVSDFMYYEGEKLDVAVRLAENNYKNNVSVSAYLVDLKLSKVDLKEILNQKSIYDKLRSEGFEKNINDLNDINSLIPLREDFTKIYKYLRLIKSHPIRVDLLNSRLFDNQNNIFKIYVALDVFEELGILKLNKSVDKFRISINNLKNKVNIEDSEILKGLKRFVIKNYNEKGES